MITVKASKEDYKKLIELFGRFKELPKTHSLFDVIETARFFSIPHISTKGNEVEIRIDEGKVSSLLRPL